MDTTTTTATTNIPISTPTTGIANIPNDVLSMLIISFLHLVILNIITYYITVITNQSLNVKSNGIVILSFYLYTSQFSRLTSITTGTDLPYDCFWFSVNL